MPYQRRTPAERKRLVAAFRESGLTQRAFAEREGINVTSLQDWLYRRHRNTENIKHVAAPAFVRVEARAPEAAHGARIDLGGGVVVHLNAVPDPAYVAELVRTLAC